MAEQNPCQVCAGMKQADAHIRCADHSWAWFDLNKRAAEAREALQVKLERMQA